ncbi:MAG: hypothetical protein LBE30_12405 [Comamonas sp.]|jgi:hypothetical protein|nr:hypothetical protein [Comamonas sp.]
MNNDHLNQHTAALLEISARHLLGNEDWQTCVQQYQQLWQAARSSGNRQAQQSIRDLVVTVGRQLQARRGDPRAKALWLALMGLRCSMLMPRMRF